MRSSVRSTTRITPGEILVRSMHCLPPDISSMVRHTTDCTVPVTSSNNKRSGRASRPITGSTRLSAKSTKWYHGDNVAAFSPLSAVRGTTVGPRCPAYRLVVGQSRAGTAPRSGFCWGCSHVAVFRVRVGVGILSAYVVEITARESLRISVLRAGRWQRS